jgi:FMN phosphatase YigB (HAD superfamily)
MPQTIIFFDLDSTLVVNQFSRKVMHQVLEQIAPVAELSPQSLGREMGDENLRRQQTDPDHPLTMDWGDIVRMLADKYGVTLTDDVDDLWRKYAAADDVEVLDDAPSMLADLRTGRRLVVATKGLSKYQLPVLDVTGLKPYFDDILTPDVTGYLKTSPQYFDKYRHQDARFIQVGDHFYDDVICAKRNGFYSILRLPIEDLDVYTPYERVERLDDYLDAIKTYPDVGTSVRPDAVVTSLQEVPHIVRDLEARAAE